VVFLAVLGLDGRLGRQVVGSVVGLRSGTGADDAGSPDAAAKVTLPGKFDEQPASPELA
jgi:hypothetical protein